MLKNLVTSIFDPAYVTAEKLNLSLKDLFSERLNNLSRYCSDEKEVYLVLMTRTNAVSSDQSKAAIKKKNKEIKEQSIPPFKLTQNVIAAVTALRERHDSFYCFFCFQ